MIHVYCFPALRKIILSDHPSAKIKDKYGRQYELLTSIKEKQSVEVLIPRIMKPYAGYELIEWYVAPRRKLSDEAKARIGDARRGIPRSEETKRKTSATMKGKSNFAGKRHSEETKRQISNKMRGNENATELLWCHNPITGEETRISDISELPEDWVLGRDYYSTESMQLARKYR